MKKTLVSALTTALVVGAASTTFAAANPFSDVPADHWAYDAVSQLAADGVIEGYGDTTFRGNQNITRYEMAQMIAKAMAKSDVSAADKALIDKLAAEFSDELNNLGVRVSNLERNADNVKWNGQARYRYWSQRYENEKGSKDKKNTDQLNFRLEPSAEVNSHWHVNARLDASTDLAKDNKDDNANPSLRHGSDSIQDTDVTLKRVWAQGNYGNFQVKLGKFAQIDNDSIFDTSFSGAEVQFGNKVTFTAGAGRQNMDNDSDFTQKFGHNEDTANYQYAGLGYADGKFVGGVDYHHLNADSFQYAKEDSTKQANEDNANIWLAKAAYRFDKTNALNGFYANNTSADELDKAWSAQYSYKGAEAQNKGTWGAWAAYRYLGDKTDLFSTFDVILAGQKGWEVGTNYAPFKNVVATLRYGHGKNIATDHDIENLFGRVEVFF